MKSIRILTPKLELLGEIDNYLSLSFCRKYHSPGEFQMVSNNKLQNTEILEINNLIMLGADRFKVGIIRHKEITTNENGEEVMTVKGYTLGTIAKQRITIPPISQACDIQETNAETVMKNYIRRNCLDIEAMAFDNLIIAPDQSRGEWIRWQSRYKNLCDELEQISLVTSLGWCIYADLDLKKWVFEVYEGRDLTTGQQINPPVVFSPEFGNVKSQEFIDSLFGYGNYAIVAGRGEGADREIITTGSSQKGLDLYVVFIDARDVENSDDLAESGKARLSEHRRIVSFQSEILTKGPFEYQKDWDVGDIVTVQNKDRSITMNSRITEVMEIYESAGFRLSAVFGNSYPTLSQKFKSSMNAMNIESKR